MFGITNYQMFFTSCVILALIPGSDTFFVLGQSISNDRKTGVLSTLGIGSGILVHTLLATFGLSLNFSLYFFICPSKILVALSIAI